VKFFFTLINTLRTCLTKKCGRFIWEVWLEGKGYGNRDGTQFIHFNRIKLCRTKKSNVLQ
jgi:hypothetical protein